MYVVGTAGHVDHGKSTLVKALTGIDPDRLEEEKRREMTIDLGFAWLTLPNGAQVSIVDVPGHERFIKNMLAGVGGIDAALLVVAADDGPMPQTREHLAILDLLQIEHGLVALSKRDLVDDDWLALVEADIRTLLAPTSLANAPIVPLSARTGAGLDELKFTLASVLATATPRPDLGLARLPLDRAFTIAGFGTVVTGTLLDGSLRVGQEVTIAPNPFGPIKARVRGLQMHKQKVELATPGNRVAVNLSGVDVGQLRRGQVLSTTTLEPSDRLDVSLNVLPTAPPIEQNDALDLFVGAAETPARVTVLQAERINPGQQGWAQLRLANSVVALRGDHFILRRPSPSDTLAGGRIVDPHPPRHRRFQPSLTAQLATLAQGTPADLLLATLTTPHNLKSAASLANLDNAAAQSAASELVQTNRALQLGSYYLAAPAWQTLRDRLADTLAQYHAQYPLRLGIGKEELRGKLDLETKPFTAILTAALAENLIAEADDGLYHLPSFTPTLTPAQAIKAAQLRAALAAHPYDPPDPTTIGFSDRDNELLALLTAHGDIVRAGDIYFSPPAYAEIEAAILAHLEREGYITLAQLRDLTHTSRKYALALLEHTDAQKLTRRLGDVRVRWQ